MQWPIVLMGEIEHNGKTVQTAASSEENYWTLTCGERAVELQRDWTYDGYAYDWWSWIVEGRKDYHSARTWEQAWQDALNWVTAAL